MEKLPMNKKKATLLKTWKRRFFRAADGWLHYYEVNRGEITSFIDISLDRLNISVEHYTQSHPLGNNPDRKS